MRESGINISGNHVTFEKPVNVYMLKKINGALEQIKTSKDIKEIKVDLNLTELQIIRRMLITEDISTRLSYHSVVESIQYSKFLKETE